MGLLAAVRRPVTRVKTADQTVNNSTVQVDDTALQFPIGANETWLIRLTLVYNSSTTADLKVRIEATGATGGVSWDRLSSAAPGASTAPTFARSALGSDQILGGVGADIFATADIDVTAGAAPTTVKVRWAQNGAEASDTKVLAGSTLVAHRA